MSSFPKVMSYRWSVFPTGSRDRGGHLSEALHAALHPGSPLGPSLRRRRTFCSGCIKVQVARVWKLTVVPGLLGIGWAEVHLSVSLQ